MLFTPLCHRLLLERHRPRFGGYSDVDDDELGGVTPYHQTAMVDDQRRCRRAFEAVSASMEYWRGEATEFESAGTASFSTELFDVDVSGRDFRHGKPHPEMFLAAAQALGVDPSSAVVLEDAAAGVRAAKAGGMAAIGIARADDADLLVDAGADLVVRTLDEVDRSALRQGRLATRPPGA